MSIYAVSGLHPPPPPDGHKKEYLCCTLTSIMKMGPLAQKMYMDIKGVPIVYVVNNYKLTTILFLLLCRAKVRPLYIGNFSKGFDP